MKQDFTLFSVPHLLILAAIPTIALVCSVWSRGKPTRTRWICFSLGTVIATNELTSYAYRIHNGLVRFPDGLPFHLCDITLWITVIAIFTLKPWSFELAYFWGLAGTTMALLTPDLWVSFPSYPAIQFFLAHGSVVIAVLYMTWTKLTWLRRGCVGRALIILNAYAVVVGIFNAILKTNYLYLCEKPGRISLLEYLGPWPVYIIGGEVLAVLFFILLWLPFRRGSAYDRLQ